jgi:hypothetical protein
MASGRNNKMKQKANKRKKKRPKQRQKIKINPHLALLFSDGRSCVSLGLWDFIPHHMFISPALMERCKNAKYRKPQLLISLWETAHKNVVPIRI